MLLCVRAVSQYVPIIRVVTGVPVLAHPPDAQDVPFLSAVAKPLVLPVGRTNTIAILVGMIGLAPIGPIVRGRDGKIPLRRGDDATLGVGVGVTTIGLIVSSSGRTNDYRGRYKNNFYKNNYNSNI